MDQYKCTKCSNLFSSEDFTFRRRNGKITPKSWCKGCAREHSRKGRKEGRHKQSAEATRRSIERAKLDRLSGRKLGRFILEDTRRSDKKKGLANDLDRDFIDNIVAQPCAYCGANDARMTLDRIDNEVGHVKSNVTPSCYRCNLIRGSMPYEAWLNIVPAIRQTHELGLFGDWRKEPIARKKKE